MKNIIEYLAEGFAMAIGIFIIIFVVVGVFSAKDAHNKTWTIEDGKFKSIYDDYEDCFRTNLGTQTTDICDDENKVIYKNK